MPRNLQEIIKKGIDRSLFIQKQEEKAPKRKLTRVKDKKIKGTLFAKRNKKVAIIEGASRLNQIIITYKKITTGETNKYIVAPYSWRYRKLRIGRKKMLFAYDMEDKHIKGFVLSEIKKVVLTDRKYRPKWPVEIGVQI